MNEWNLKQIENVIKEIDRLMAKFQMDSLGNEASNILIEAQSKLQELSSYYTGEEY